MGNQIETGVVIALDKPYFYSGQDVTGAVYVNLAHNHNIREISLNVTGRENTSWLKSTTYLSKTDLQRIDEFEAKEIEQGRTVNNRVRKNGERVVFSLLNSFGSVPFGSGQYSFPFKFYLPAGLPSSFEYIDEVFNCSITYWAECRATKRDGTQQVFKNMFFVRTPKEVFNYPLTQSSFAEVSNWCSNKGKSGFSASINASSFSWLDVAQIKLDFDNTLSQIAITGFSVGLTQKLNFKSNNDDNEFLTRRLTSQIMGLNVNPGEKGSSNIILTLKDDDNVTQKYASESKNNELIQGNSFSIANIISTVKGNLISNEYYIVIDINFEGVQCCSGPGALTFPILIYAKEIDFNLNSLKPNNWNPQVINTSTSTVPSGGMSGGFDAKGGMSGGMSGGYDAGQQGGMAGGMSGGYDAGQQGGMAGGMSGGYDANQGGMMGGYDAKGYN